MSLHWGFNFILFMLFFFSLRRWCFNEKKRKKKSISQCLRVSSRPVRQASPLGRRPQFGRGVSGGTSGGGPLQFPRLALVRRQANPQMGYLAGGPGIRWEPPVQSAALGALFLPRGSAPGFCLVRAAPQLPSSPARAPRRRRFAAPFSLFWALALYFSPSLAGFLPGIGASAVAALLVRHLAAAPPP